MINTSSAFQAPLISKQYTLETCEHDEGGTNASVNCMEKSLKSDLRLINLGAQLHMQTPAAPLLAPLSMPSSPSSSFFLDQNIDASEKQSHKAFKLKDVPSLPELDDGDEEVDNVAVDEERPLERSHWSDDSDADGEDIEDQLDNEDKSGVRDTPKTAIDARDKEANEEAFKVKEKKDMETAVVPEKTDDETAN